MINEIKEILKLMSNNTITYHFKDGNPRIKSDTFNIIDSEGFMYSSSYNSLYKNYKRNSRLIKYYKNNPHSIYNIKLYIKVNNIKLELISTQYTSYEDLLIFKCNKHGEVLYSLCNLLRYGKCPKCSDRYKYTFDNVKTIFMDRGFIPLFDSYKNANEKMPCINSEGYKVVISLGKLLLNRTPQIFSISNPYSYENMKRWLKINHPEYELISEQYIGAKSNNYYKFYCKKHSEEFTMTLNHMLHGETCNLCFRERTSGENHHGYNPLLTDEERTLKRAFLGEEAMKIWRNRVFIRDNYTCQCCGKVGGDMNAHHLDGYHWCKDGRTDIDNGVTLCKKCHDDFHLLYGNKNNTYTQFFEYCIDNTYLDKII